MLARWVAERSAWSLRVTALVLGWLIVVSSLLLLAQVFTTMQSDEVMDRHLKVKQRLVRQPHHGAVDLTVAGGPKDKHRPRAVQHHSAHSDKRRVHRRHREEGGGGRGGGGGIPNGLRTSTSSSSSLSTSSSPATQHAHVEYPKGQPRSQPYYDHQQHHKEQQQHQKEEQQQQESERPVRPPAGDTAVADAANAITEPDMVHPAVHHDSERHDDTRADRQEDGDDRQSQLSMGDRRQQEVHELIAQRKHFGLAADAPTSTSTSTAEPDSKAALQHAGADADADAGAGAEADETAAVKQSAAEQRLDGDRNTASVSEQGHSNSERAHPQQEEQQPPQQQQEELLSSSTVAETSPPGQEEQERKQQRLQEHAKQQKEKLKGKSKKPLPSLSPLTEISSSDEAELTWSMHWSPEQRTLSASHVSTNTSNQPAQPLIKASTDLTVDKLTASVDFSEMEKGWHPRHANPDDASLTSDKPLEVIFMPHTHVDPGWIRTLDDYYHLQTKKILDTVTDFLSERPFRKFVWAEISFLQLWWDDSSKERREAFRRLVQNGQIEIVTGGWVMTEEACSHYFSMLDQLVEGQLWVNETLGVVPTTGWSVDPFGHSPTMAFLNHKAGLKGLVVDRIHWRIKQQMQQRQQLVFRWQQEWDTSGSTAIATHTLPFYLYDVHYTCGPDYAVCCQLDYGLIYFKNRAVEQCTEFKAKTTVHPLLPGYEQNAAKMLLAQYKKTALLFKNNVILHPIGGDFRYTSKGEIAAQLDSFTRIMQYFNSHPELNVKVRFGTLRDYFSAIERKATPDTYQTLSGHFFPYSDRGDHYWTGFYSTRLYLKRLSRELERMLRSTEVLHSLALAKLNYPQRVCPECGLRLTRARRELGILQHHDAITGTAKAKVVKNYVKRLKAATDGVLHVSSRSIATVSAAGDPNVIVAPAQRFEQDAYAVVDRVLSPTSHGLELWIPNTALQRYRGPLRVLVDSPHIDLTADAGPVSYQVMPLFDASGLPRSGTYALWFAVDIPALTVAKLRLQATSVSVAPAPPSLHIAHRGDAKPKQTLKDSSSDSYFKAREEGFADGIVVQQGDLRVECNGETGLLENLAYKGQEISAHLEFRLYSSRTGKDDHSGAYLFMPQSVSQYSSFNGTVIRVIKGPLVSEIQVQTTHFLHTLRLFDTERMHGRTIQIENSVDMSVQHEVTIQRKVKVPIKTSGNTGSEEDEKKKKNFETSTKPVKTMQPCLKDVDLVMSIQTNVGSGKFVHFDLNGFQMTAKERRADVRVNGQYMPVNLMAFLQSDTNRLTVHTNTALGMASLKHGHLEVMLGRSHMRDDNLGLGEGITSDKLTTTRFALQLEPLRGKEADAAAASSISMPSLEAHAVSDQLNFPPVIHAAIEGAADTGNTDVPLTPKEVVAAPDLHLVQLRSLLGTHEPHDARARTLLTLHRRGADCMQAKPCDAKSSTQEVDISAFLEMLNADSFEETSVSGVLPRKRSSSGKHQVRVATMDVATMVVHGKRRWPS